MLRRNVTLYIVQRINLNRLDGIRQTFDCLPLSLSLSFALYLYSSLFPSYLQGKCALSTVFIHHTMYDGDSNILFFDFRIQSES